MQAPMPPTYGTMPPQPMAAPMPVGSGGAGVSKWLSVVALLLAVAALAVSVVVPGPTGVKGDTGPQGPAGQDGTNGAQGPAGPGSLMVTASHFSYGTITTTCTNYAGAEVTITVPGPGTVLVSGHVLGRMDHTAGNSVWMYVYVERSGSVLCTDDSYWGYMSVNSDEPTGMYFDTIPVMHAYGVGTAGTYTYAVDAECGGVGGSCLLLESALAAVFYPS